MRKLLRKIDRRFQLSRPGSVLILVVALLVLMALIGTAFLSTQRVDRYNSVQHTNNTEIDLLLEGVKNMAKATIVGSLNDPALPFPYRPANSTLAKNWDAYDLYHQFTTDTGITSTPNDAWLSPRCPWVVPLPPVGSPYPGGPTVVWPCIGEPLTGSTFESPIVLPQAGSGSASLAGVSLTYGDRMTYDFVPVSAPAGSRLTPTFANISYPDGTTANYPAFVINSNPSNPTPTYYTYLAGDADGDGIADAGLFKLPVGQINGITYYAAVRIVDNCAAVNVNIAMSRRYDLTGLGVPTRAMTVTTLASDGVLNGTAVSSAVSTPTYNGIYNLGCFPSNVGLAELLESYDGRAADNQTGVLGMAVASPLDEWDNLLRFRFNAPIPAAGFTGVVTQAGSAPTGSSPIADTGAARSDFAFTTLGDLFSSQIGRRPSNPGYSAAGYSCLAFTDSDAADLCYHFIFNDPYTARTPLELALHNSVYDNSPNGPGEPPNAAGTSANTFSPTGPPTRTYDNAAGLLPGMGATQYGPVAPGSAAALVAGWYADNFDWTDDFDVTQTPINSTYFPNPLAESCMDIANENTQNAGQYYRPRRSILTADSAVSNLTPRPLLTAYGTTTPITVEQGMSTITSTMCKTSVNTATFPDLWRAFWLSMAGDNGLSPLGNNTGFVAGSGYTVPATTTYYDHDLVANQSIYTGSQFENPFPATSLTVSGQSPKFFQTPPTPTYPQHPQAMFRSPLRNPTNVYYGSNCTYIEADQMVLLRSAIAAANTTAMRYPVQGSSAPIFAYDVPLKATVHNAPNTQIYARVYGVTQQPYITEVYANTDTSISNDPETANLQNTAPYVAIELFNPYNQDIDLTGWQLATIDRSPTSDNTRALTVIHRFQSTDPVHIIPHYNAGTATGTNTNVYQGGYALLEDFGAPGVTYRPASSQLPPTTAIPSTTGTTAYGGPLNVISVPELSTLIPKTPSLSSEELVLLRPAAAGGSAAAATESAGTDQVPVDSYDFTGLNWGNTDNTTVPPTPLADTWHYVRGNAINSGNTTNALWRFIYPGRYDASDPTPYAATASAAAPTATATPPNRAVVAPPAYVAYSRRQQGTQAAHYRAVDTLNPTNATDPFDTMVGQPPNPTVSLGGANGAVPASNDNNAGASYPVTFPFQYLNDDQPGAWPLTNTSPGNYFPFHQFARNSDMLQIPYVGSYVIFTAAPTGYQSTGTAASPISATDVSNILEVNALPMDCSFAEDTDISDDPPAGVTNVTASETNLVAGSGPYLWNESVGHFAPVNTQTIDNSSVSGRDLPTSGEPNANQTIADSDPTLAYTNGADPAAPYKVQYTGDSASQRYWRYHWASRIFDYLTVQNPNDDYFPNVQQQIYSQTPATNPPGIVYGPQPLPVQNTSSISPPANTTLVGTYPANPNAEDTVPVYGPININTAPWRVLSALRLCPFDDAEAGANNYLLNSSGGVTAGPTIVPLNTQLAMLIAEWRDQSGTAVSSQVTSASPAYPYTVYKGPFTSVADVLNVPAVQGYLTRLNFQNATGDKQPTEPDPVQGHLSPFDFYGTPTSPTFPAQNGSGSLLTDGVRNDVEERFDFLSRLSNQITTKSDVYTVYIVIQGWRNAGSTSTTNPPQMVTQKRAAFIIDRTGVTPTSSNVKIINVPTD